jgi:hypothetical protein
MPAFGNVVINDGQGTPAAHTFAPVAIEGTVANYADRAGGIPVGYGLLSIGLRNPPNGNGVYKAAVKVLIPTLEQSSPSTSTGIQPAPTVAYTTAIHMDFLLPARSSLQERKNILAYAKNALAHATVSAVVENLENVY